MGLGKKPILNETQRLIYKVGILPLIYDGNIDIITNRIDTLKTEYPEHCAFLKYFIDENLKYFIDHSLFYKKYSKDVRLIQY